MPLLLLVRTARSMNIPETSRVPWPALLLTVMALVAMILFRLLGSEWTLPYLIAAVTVISIAIWQACDPFADAAQWIGNSLRLPGSVRGATLDAVSSSMPELFSGIFFVLAAISAGDGEPQSLVDAGAEGFGATIATCAGSAVYNMILIPAACALVISFRRKEHPVIDVDPEVIFRDGLWFVMCEMVLILFLFQDTMRWWMALVLIAGYLLYIAHLVRDARLYRERMGLLKRYLASRPDDLAVRKIIGEMASDGYRVSRTMVAKARGELEKSGDDEEDHESAGVFFNYWHVRLNHMTAWAIIAIATLAAAIACYCLVEVTRATAEYLEVPTFFVAVILAAAASSVPDTLLSIGSAMRGDDGGAISNAFGSNIFDICICLSIPLLINSYLTGWQPVSLLQDGEPIPGLLGLRILLVGLTVATLALMWWQQQLTRNKALLLCGLYGVFIAYAVLGSLQVGW